MLGRGEVRRRTRAGRKRCAATGTEGRRGGAARQQGPGGARIWPGRVRTGSRGSGQEAGFLVYPGVSRAQGGWLVEVVRGAVGVLGER